MTELFVPPNYFTEEDLSEHGSDVIYIVTTAESESSTVSNNNKNHESEKPAKGKGKKVFSVRDDILMLTELIATLPMCQPSYKEKASAWKTAAINLKSKWTVTTLQERFKNVMEKFEKSQMQSLKSSGTEEDFSERENLLTDLTDRITSYALTTSTEKKAIKEAEKKKNAGEDIRLKAATSETDTLDNDPSSPPASSSKLVGGRKRKIVDLFLQSQENDDFHRSRLLEFEKEKFEEEKKQRVLDKEMEEKRIKIQEDMVKNQHALMMEIIKHLNTGNK